jgi:hypothetical protein
MAEPATQPNSSFSHVVKPRKLKTPKEKSQRQHQRQIQVAVSSSDAGGATTTGGFTSTSAAAAVSAVGMADYDVEFGDFDYDAVKADEGAELWLVRAPTSVRPALFFLSLFYSRFPGGPFFFLPSLLFFF